MNTTIDYSAHLPEVHRAFMQRTITTNTGNFGGWTMELDESGSTDEPTPEGQEPDETGDTETPSEEEAPSSDETEETPEGEEGGEDDESPLDLPGAKKALSKVRKSEASMRTRLRDIEAKLADAKAPEQVEELLASVRKENADESRSLLVENIALRHNLPDDLAAVLKGDTRDELDAHAKALAKYAPQESHEDPELSGGLDPSGDSGNFDPKKAALEARAARYR